MHLGDSMHFNMLLFTSFKFYSRESSKTSIKSNQYAVCDCVLRTIPPNKL